MPPMPDPPIPDRPRSSSMSLLSPGVHCMASRLSKKGAVARPAVAAIVYFAVMRAVRPLLAISLLFLLSTGGGAQRASTVDPAMLSPLHWRSIGPANTGGRIDDFAVARVAGSPDAIY